MLLQYEPSVKRGKTNKSTVCIWYGASQTQPSHTSKNSHIFQCACVLTFLGQIIHFNALSEGLVWSQSVFLYIYRELGIMVMIISTTNWLCAHKVRQENKKPTGLAQCHIGLNSGCKAWQGAKGDNANPGIYDFGERQFTMLLSAAKPLNYLCHTSSAGHS